MMRLQKYLSKCGVASRRNAEKIIAQGRVKVNGQTVSAMGSCIDEEVDIVEVDDSRVYLIDEIATFILNKPLGVVTTMDDPQKRPTVAPFIKKVNLAGGFPVGRLDINTSGLLLLTNDGDLAHRLSHPSNCVEKTYVATLDKSIKKSDIAKLEEGVDIGGFVTGQAKVSAINDNQTAELTIHEGKNRQVRRMFAALGYRVTKLKRTRYGILELGDLKPGEMRRLSDFEVDRLAQ